MEDISFEDFNLKMPLLRGIFSYGFTEPSTIQKKSIPIITKGKDILAQSQSGTGKTGSFVISSLQLMSNDSKIQAIVVAPTREIAIQIHSVYRDLGSYMNYNYELCIGGIPYKNTSSEKPTIIIGTLGRILDMIEKQMISTQNVKLLIIDEADELLSDNFQNQLYSMVQSVDKACQIIMFSATLTKEVIEISKKIMRNPEILKLKQEEITLDGISQYYINCDKEDYKYDALMELFTKMLKGQTIVFVNTTHNANKLKHKLEVENYVVSIIHSKLNQSERNDIMTEFRENRSTILISTDLLSRGIDIQGIKLVVNFDIPNNKESYIHRIGRSGRYGKKGVAVNFVTDRDVWKIEELENYYEMHMKCISNFDKMLESDY